MSEGQKFRAIVLAGERPGGSVLARALNLPAGILAPLAGQPCISRVVDALNSAGRVDGLTLVGPDRQIIDANEPLRDLLERPGLSWLPPQPGPAASALQAARNSDHYPLLLTSGDHGLLTAAIVDSFCEQAWAARDSGADFLVGLVPYPLVREAFPESRRTVLRFADRALCGSNLFALLTPTAQQALAFWQQVEADRKRPWKIARHLGAATLARYLAGRLGTDDAFAVLSQRSGCRIGWLPVDSARAAVDVDSEADWRLADAVLSGQRPDGP